MYAKISAVASVCLLLLPGVVAGVLSSRRDTPNFYLVATSTDATAHLQSIKASGNTASFTNGTPVKFFLEGEYLTVDNGDPKSGVKTVINSLPMGTVCSTGGEVMFIGGTSNKCAKSTPFSLSSYDQNSQLGAKLVFNKGGSFYSCSGGVVKYDNSPPSGCTSVELWTVPATA